MGDSDSEFGEGEERLNIALATLRLLLLFYFIGILGVIDLIVNISYRLLFFF